jgi:GWxTD domain-containing protein
MKRIFLLLLVIACSGYAAQATNLTALLSHCAFNTPENKPYVETYLSVLGNSVHFKPNAQGKLQAAVEVGITFSQNNVIKAFKKYTLNSQEATDSLNPPNFIDQQRFPLDAGDYVLEIRLVDKNKPSAAPVSLHETIQVFFPVNQISISGIERIESYTKASGQSILTKNGYDLVPYIANFYPQNMKALAFYAELYNTHKVPGENEPFVVNYFIESYDYERKLDKFGGYFKGSGKPVTVVFGEIPIADLPSGKYNLVIEVHDKKNTLICYGKTYFQRINPTMPSAEAAELAAKADLRTTFVYQIHNVDSLTEAIRCLRPISSDIENSLAENDVHTKDINVLQRRLLIFWTSHNPQNPELAYTEYMMQVKAVQHSYGTRLLQGYNTDRGRVYLKYGEPSTRQISDKEPSAYPYEIWTYYRLNNGQNNRKFVFYDPDLVTNNYRLIHSDATGETYDANWDVKIRKRNNQSTNLDVEQSPDQFGGNAQDDFNHPK